MKSIFILIILFVSFSFAFKNLNEFENEINQEQEQPIDLKSWYSLLNDFTIVSGKVINESTIAWGYFQDDLFQDGWGKLNIETSSIVSDDIAFRGAGFLEGYLTWSNIYNFSQNYFNSNFNTSNLNDFPLGVINFVKENYEYMLNQLSLNSPINDPYWLQVNNSINQLNGVFEGYNTAVVINNQPEQYQLDFIEIYLLNLYGDIEDIISVTSSSQHEFKPMSRKELEVVMVKSGHCTTLIKLMPNNSDIYVAHTTWSQYADMMRIYKRIKIPVASTPYGYETLFSSYPGLLVSIDDFYMIKPSKLQLTETLNSILNQSLYNNVTPNSFLYWIRNLVANRLSNSGFEWISYFIIENSGTNNIQFMIVDYKLFTPYQSLEPGTLWIVEQYPGGYVAEDVTFTLINQGYWPSYNRPYSQLIFDLMGYPYYVELYGDLFTYEYNPRANIFRRDQGSVQSILDMQNIIEYNQYKTDPDSDGYPGNAIAARYDLGASPYQPADWFYKGAWGGIDGKFVNSAMFESFIAFAKNGPTVNSECPAFSWSNWEEIIHQGLPNTFNFTWILIDL